MNLLDRLVTMQLLMVAAVAFPAAPALQSDVQKVKLQISGGYQTVGVDRGRPVILIAAALGVKDEVFRDAFSGVHPEPGGREPDPREVNRNKSVLMQALSKYGVTNENLDRVSNYYRYRPGEMWRYQPAEIEAEIVGSQVVRVTVTRGGAGYSSKPVLTIPGHHEIKLEVTMSYGTDFTTNGSIKQVRVVTR